jgi:hypothetical protein
MKRALLQACLLAGLAGTMSAQSGKQAILKSDVPFAFVSRDQTIPAGEYSIEIGEKWIRFTNAEGHPVQAIVPNSCQDSSTEPRLIFRQYGDRYFLWQLRTGTRELRFRLPRDERNLEPRQGVVTTEMR